MSVPSKRSARPSTKPKFAALISIFYIPLLLLSFLDFTPFAYYALPIYWSGLAIFVVLGFFALLASGKRAGKIGQLIVVISFVGLYLVYRSYPDSLPFGIGALDGLFLGLYGRIFYWLRYQTLYAYCPQCGRSLWASKKDGQLFCAEGHPMKKLSAEQKQ